MTTGSPKPTKESKSRNSKQAIVDEKSPLLPTKHGEDGGFDEFNGASFSGAVFNLSTTVVGAGIMALPATMKVLGLIPGIVVIIFMAFLTEASIELLLRFSRTSKSVSYGGLMGDAFGKYGRMLIQLCVLVNNIGVLVVYMIIIGDVLSGTTSDGIHHAGVLEGWFGEHWWNRRFFVLLITTIAIFAPLASLKRIDSLRYTSALSVALAVAFLVITVGITLFKLVNGTTLMPRLFPDVTNLTSFLHLFTVVPVLVTAYICHYNGTDMAYQQTGTRSYPFSWSSLLSSPIWWQYTATPMHCLRTVHRTVNDYCICCFVSRRLRCLPMNCEGNSNELLY